MFLFGQGVFSDQSPTKRGDLEPRGKAGSVDKGALTFGICVAALDALIAAAPFTFGISLLGIPEEIALCAAAGIAIAAGGFSSKPSNPPQPPPVRDIRTLIMC